MSPGHNHQVRPKRRRQPRDVFDVLAAWLRPDPSEDPESLRREEEKLTRVRLALFGCAPNEVLADGQHEASGKVRR